MFEGEIGKSSRSRLPGCGGGIPAPPYCLRGKGAEDRLFLRRGSPVGFPRMGLQPWRKGRKCACGGTRGRPVGRTPAEGLSANPPQRFVRTVLAWRFPRQSITFELGRPLPADLFKSTRAGRSIISLELEGELHARTIFHNLPFLDPHVQLFHLGNPDVPQALGRRFKGRLWLLPPRNWDWFRRVRQSCKRTWLSSFDGSCQRLKRSSCCSSADPELALGLDDKAGMVAVYALDTYGFQGNHAIFTTQETSGNECRRCGDRP